MQVIASFSNNLLLILNPEVRHAHVLIIALARVVSVS